MIESLLAPRRGRGDSHNNWIRFQGAGHQVVQRLEISEQTFHRWRNQYWGMKAKEAKRLKELEQENTRLKRAVAELTLDKQIIREAVDFLGKA
ncbi:MAG: transposase [Phycisphaerales bacterium]|nr:transposase [Phycisphaerales bacterium]